MVNFGESFKKLLHPTTTAGKLNSSEQQNSSEAMRALFPKLLARTQEVVSHFPAPLQALADKALLSSFYPEKASSPESSPSTLQVLGVESFPEQIKNILAQNPDYNLQEGLENSLCAFIDAKNLKRINELLGDHVGDQYILANLESFLEIESKLDVHVVIGRLTGNEIVAYILPKDSNQDLSPLLEPDQKGSETTSKKSLESMICNVHNTHNTITQIQEEINKQGHDVDIGCHFSATTIQQVPAHPASRGKQHHRHHNLLSHIITALEHPLQLPTSESSESISPELATILTKERLIPISKDVSTIIDRLPPSLQAEYAKVTNTNPELSAQALALASTAAWERLYPETTVYKSSYLEEFAQKLKGQGYALVYFADMDVKELNKTSHKHGDDALIRAARLAHEVGSKLSEEKEIFLFQVFGSFAVLVPEDKASDFATTINKHTKAFGEEGSLVATAHNYGQKNQLFSINESVSDNKNWNELREQLRQTHYLHETLELIRRHFDPETGWIEEGFYVKFGSRLNSRLSQLAKFFPDTFNQLKQDQTPEVFGQYFNSLSENHKQKPNFQYRMQKFLVDLIRSSHRYYTPNRIHVLS